MIVRGATRILAWILAVVVCSLTTGIAFASERHEAPAIGVLFSSPPALARPFREAFDAGLRQLGYVEGKNLIVFTRYADGDPARLPSLLRELIALKVQALVVPSTAVDAATDATKTIPIVCPTLGNPLRDGLASSFAHPGGNLTGLYGMAPETDAKRLQFAMEIVPGLKRVGVLFEDVPATLADAEALRANAKGLGLSLITYAARDAQELQRAISKMESDGLQAAIVFNTPLLLAHRDTLLRSLSHVIPVISEGRDFARAGALLTYSPDYIDMYRRSAEYVDKILKGARPGEIPIERAATFDLVVNMRTAKLLRLAIPESILLGANEVLR